jgi:uncharacterized protein
MALNYLLFLVTHSAQSFYTRAIMSQPLASTPAVTPVITQPQDQQAANVPTSTAQIDAQLTTTSATEPNVSEPRLSNQAAPNSPFEARADLPNSEAVALRHTAPHARDQASSANSIAESTVTTSKVSSINSISEKEKTAAPLDNDNFLSNDTTFLDFLVEIKKLNDMREMFEQASQALKASNEQMDYQLVKILGPQYHLSKAAIQARIRADKGDAESQFILGNYYEHGSGVKQDYIEAEKLYRKAAKQGHAGAMRALGVMYEFGYGVKRATAYAVIWYQQAANLGDAYAQVKHGVMLWDGIGINKDEAAAVSWFLKAADQGSISAMDLLVTAYKMGIGVKKDDKLAAYWFLKSLQEQSEDGVLDLSKYLDLLDFIPDVLNQFKEFENLTTIMISSILVDTKDFLPIAKLIRSNTPIQAINLNKCLISEPTAQLLIKALENNVSLTVLHIDPILISPPMHATIKKLLEQNIAIAELRKHVKESFLKNSNFLPLEVLVMVIDRTIVSFIKSGKNKEATQNAIDELMMSLRI